MYMLCGSVQIQWLQTDPKTTEEIQMEKRMRMKMLYKNID
jgi:hypothetical protein